MESLREEKIKMDFSKLKKQVILKGGKILDPIENTIKKVILFLKMVRLKHWVNLIAINQLI